MCYIKTAHSNCKIQTPRACKLEKNGHSADIIVLQLNPFTHRHSFIRTRPSIAGTVKLTPVLFVCSGVAGRAYPHPIPAKPPRLPWDFRPRREHLKPQARRGGSGLNLPRDKGRCPPPGHCRAGTASLAPWSYPLPIPATTLLPTNCRFQQKNLKNNKKKSKASEVALGLPAPGNGRRLLPGPGAAGDFLILIPVP